MNKQASTRVVWGVGDTARQLAALISQAVEARTGVQGLIQDFEPQGEPFAEFRDLITRVAEATRIKGRDTELEVKIILACWEIEDIDITALFRTISKTLDIALAVERTFTLTLLLPPPTAGVVPLNRVFSSFVALEVLLGELPFLNSIFVYQLPLEVYRGPLAGAETTQDLVEVISREFADPHVLEFIHQLVYPVMRLKQQTAGRSAMYAAIGAQRLRYRQIELLHHLETRFQYDLLQEGLLALDAVSSLVMGRTTKLADECVIDLSRAIAPYQGTRPKSESRLPLLFAVGDPKAMTGPAFDGKLDAAISVIQAELEPLFAELGSKLKQAFDDVLALQGQNIACATHFLELVESHPAREAVEGGAVDPQDLFKVAQVFTNGPFLKDSIAFIRQVSETLAVESGISLTTRDAEADPVSALDARIEALQAAFSDTDFKSRYLIQALNATWTRLKRHGQQPWCSKVEADRTAARCILRISAAIPETGSGTQRE